MRTKNSLKNVIIAMLCNTITLLINFFTQKLFISNLGIEYSGLNSVFSNIISMLSISELGIGTAIIYHLYKPIAENDIPKIKILMNFYKKAYNAIAIAVLCIGLLIIPFINNLVSADNISENIYLLYLLFLIDSVISYTATYKRSIIYANQKNRIIDLIHLGYTILMNSFQIIVLIYFKSFIIFLLIKVICRIIENVVISCITDRFYPFLKDKCNDSLDENVKSDIKLKVKAQLFHSIGGYIVLGTDNIIISKFLGLAIAGIYGNYILIINAANTVLTQIFSALTASVGNLLVENNKEKTYEIYKKIVLINFIIYGVVTVVFYTVINDFIIIWLGNKEYLFSKTIVLLLSINIYMQGMRKTMQMFATAAGICHENRFIPLIEAAINLIASLVLLYFIGLPGVILGTIISTLILYLYSFPKYIYYPLFNHKKSEYISEFFRYTLFLIVIFIINLFFNNLFNFNNIYLNFCSHLFMSFSISVIYFIVIFKNNDEFIWLKSNILCKILKNNKE